jgi:hypothetical protein
VSAWSVVVCFVALSLPALASAQDKPAAPKMSKEEQAMMDAMMKAATPGENQKMLASLVGNWSFDQTMWMDPAAPPTKSTGTASYEMALGGRYLHGSAKGNFSGMDFEGHGITAYDNVSKQFQAVWVDNFGTGIMFMTGKYDPAAKALTFLSDMDDPMKPGTKVKVREVLRLVDPNKHVMEWYETRAGKEAKTMEIVYTRTK